MVRHITHRPYYYNSNHPIHKKKGMGIGIKIFLILSFFIIICMFTTVKQKCGYVKLFNGMLIWKVK